MRILHLEDNPGDAELVGALLAEEFPACAISVATTRDGFLTGLTTPPPPDLVISDFTLPSFDGLSALALAREHAPGIPFVFVSGSIGEERAIAAARAGAYDYVLKDSMGRLPVVVRRALEESAHRRQREEEELRRREFAGIIEHAAEAIVLSALDGRITLWSQGAARLYGMPSGDALGRTLEELFPESELVQLRTARATLREKGEWRRELSITTRDGRGIVVDFHKTLVCDDAGNPIAHLNIATDITEKRQLEEQFLRAQRLESLGLLAAGIAHDLNNILAPVLMAAPLLRQQVTTPTELHVLDILERSAERGSALVRQILGFSHGAGGQHRLTQVKHLLRDVGDVIRASFPKSIVLEERVPNDLWPIQANPTQIHQILLNLAVNARDAMAPRGGTLRLSAENRMVDEATAGANGGTQAGPCVVLSVSDTGTGIPPEVLARIWEPFFTTKGEGKGTGLGLSTVRGIAAAHGGFITVETRTGHGTTFQVFLPATKPADEKIVRPVVPPQLHGHGELILVVDDEAYVRDVTATILTRFGFRAKSCANGVEAIACFAEHNAEIKAVISDLSMPQLDGPALAVVLRRLQPKVRILAMSGIGSHDAKDAVDYTAFAAVLQKPFTADTLLGAVHQILAMDPPDDPAGEAAPGTAGGDSTRAKSATEGQASGPDRR